MSDPIWLRWSLAALHLLAFGIGVAAIVTRASALRALTDSRGLGRVFSADNWWGLAALLWIGTGLARLLLGTEKPTAYYTASPLFWTKMGLFALVFSLELFPMVTLIQWRMALRRGETPTTRSAGRLASISWLELFLVIAILVLATGLARGVPFP